MAYWEPCQRYTKACFVKKINCYNYLNKLQLLLWYQLFMFSTLWNLFNTCQIFTPDVFILIWKIMGPREPGARGCEYWYITEFCLKTSFCIILWNTFLAAEQIIFFLIGVHSMQGWTATTRHGVTRKRSTKRLKHAGNLFTKNLQLILDLKPFRLLVKGQHSIGREFQSLALWGKKLLT